jgi:hypothetical protein
VVKSKATGEKYCQHKVKLQSIYYSDKTKDWEKNAYIFLYYLALKP